MPSPSSSYVQYSDAVKQKHSDEEKTFDDIAALMLRLSGVLNDRYRHAVRSVHAKSHGLLKAELRVNSNLPEPLRQGLFAEGGRAYSSIIRFSTNPGDILADSVSTPRGMALKVLGPEGMTMLAGHDGQVTQDFVMVNAKSFPLPDAAAFLKQLQLIEKTVNQPELVKKAVSNVARGANAVLGLFGAQSTTLEQLGAPETHILGETFGTCAALRYGDYVCKMICKPASANLQALTGKHVGVNFHYSGLRDAIVDFFKTETAEWDICVQLSTNLKTMPVEDPSVEWPEDQSPYLPVARLIARPQDAYSPARRVYVDEVLAFDPWHALAAHRPLGNIMRARRKSYKASSDFRRTMNVRPAAEPRSVDDLPN
jgi:hypothetical protein